MRANVSNNDETTLAALGLGDLEGLPPLAVGMAIVERSDPAMVHLVLQNGALIMGEQLSKRLGIPRINDVALGAGMVLASARFMKLLIEAHLAAPLPDLLARVAGRIAARNTPDVLAGIVSQAADRIVAARPIAEIIRNVDLGAAGEIAQLAQLVQVAHSATERLLVVMAPLMQREGCTLQ